MAVVDESRYKSNSHRARAEEEQRERKKVTKGAVRKHEKSTLEKAREAAFGNYSGNLFEDFIFDVFIPSAKELLDISLTNAKDMILFGEVRNDGRSRTRRSGSYVEYDGYSRKARTRSADNGRRARFDFSDIEFDDLDDIDEVIEDLQDFWAVCPHPKEISVAQFYQSAGVEEISAIDNRWGWLDIRVFLNADRYKVRSRNPKTGIVEEKWVLNLPKPKPLDY